jgi:hypothetical protein
MGEEVVVSSHYISVWKMTQKCVVEEEAFTLGLPASRGAQGGYEMLEFYLNSKTEELDFFGGRALMSWWKG